MRTDCTRDNRATPLPNASHLGDGLGAAKRGHWISYRSAEYADKICGRVLGRVHADGRTWLEVVALMGAADNPSVRWIEPAAVETCQASPPRRIFEFMCGDWSDAAAIQARVARGFLSDSYLDSKA